MTAHLYRIRDEGGVLLYVGCTTHLKARIATHRRKKWCPKRVKVEVEEFPSWDEAHAVERRIIRIEKPAHNRCVDTLTAEERKERAARNREIGEQRRAKREAVAAQISAAAKARIERLRAELEAIPDEQWEREIAEWEAQRKEGGG